jgi:hypothetical protein
MAEKNFTNTPSAGFWQKPQLAKLLAAGYLAFPLIFWWQMRHAPAGLGEGAMSTLVFAQELFCAVTAATALLWVSKPSLIYLIFLSVYFLGFKLYHFSSGALDTPAEVAATMFWFAAPTALLASQARLAYTEPERRWWKRPERYAHPTGAQALARGVKFPLVVVNFSRGGAFVKLDERIFQQDVDDAREKRKDAAGRFPSVTSVERLIAVKNMHEYPKMGEVISVAIETLPGLDSPFKSNRFVTRAVVVWVTKATDPYQHGLGLQFVNVSFLDALRLRRYFQLLPPKS